eukprot:350593-Chlamydomonas_euryale.AAC.6
MVDFSAAWRHYARISMAGGVGVVSFMLCSGCLHGTARSCGIAWAVCMAFSVLTRMGCLHGIQCLCRIVWAACMALSAHAESGGLLAWHSVFVLNRAGCVHGIQCSC